MLSPNDESTGVLTLERNTVTVMPEVGCGLDNLDTMSNKEIVPLSSYNLFSFDTNENDGNNNNEVNLALAAAFITNSNKKRIECIFMTKRVENNEDEEENGSKKDKSEIIRKRVTVNLHENNNQIKSPIEYVKERKTSEESTRGSIAKGGGLFASTVASLVGKKSSNKPFCLKDTMDISSLEGMWSSSDKVESSTLNDQFWSGEKSKTLLLPDDIIVRHCEEDAKVFLEVCMLIQPSNNAGNEEDQLKRVGAKFSLIGNRDDEKKVEFIDEVKQ